MLQVKILQEVEVTSLNESVNKFLAEIKSEEVKDIQFDLNDIPAIAIIQYEVTDAWVNEKCYDCK